MAWEAAGSSKRGAVGSSGSVFSDVGAMGAGFVSFSSFASRPGGNFSGEPEVIGSVLEADVALLGTGFNSDGTGFSSVGTGFNSVGTTSKVVGRLAAGAFGAETVGATGCGVAGSVSGTAVDEGEAALIGCSASAGGVTGRGMTVAGTMVAFTPSLLAPVELGPVTTGVAGAGTFGNVGVTTGIGVVGGATATSTGCGGRRRFR